jgi:predicted ATPase
MLKYIEIEGYKSMKSVKIELDSINVLIGNNGSGKSNFVSFLKMVNAIFSGHLQNFVLTEGKADNLFYLGRKHTEKVRGRLVFSKEGEDNNYTYSFTLKDTKDGGVFIEKEIFGFNNKYDDFYWNTVENLNCEESKIIEIGEYKSLFLSNYLTGFNIYHFHDTSSSSKLRAACDINDNLYLKPDGRNLSAILFFIKQKYPKRYKRIENAVKLIAPFIDHFILGPNVLDENMIELRWAETSDVDSNFSAHQLSDGTIRFIALTTVLLQPKLPDIIVIDEPELGLHPKAVSILSGMIKSASLQSQIIISTQSVNLVDEFSPDEIIIVEREGGKNPTVLSRLNSGLLKTWLEDYTIGDLWERNILNTIQPG